jgi:hypothetical protein
MRLYSARWNRPARVVAPLDLLERIAEGLEEIGVGVEDRPVECELDHRLGTIEGGQHGGRVTIRGEESHRVPSRGFLVVLVRRVVDPSDVLMTKSCIQRSNHPRSRLTKRETSEQKTGVSRENGSHDAVSRVVTKEEFATP